MTEAALRRRAMLRVLYERYGVDVKALACVANLKPRSIERFIRLEGWRELSTASLRTQLLKSLRAVIRSAKDGTTVAADVERTARALLAAARSIDAIEATEGSRDASDDKHEQVAYGPDDDDAFEAFEEVLDRTLEGIRDTRRGMALRTGDEPLLSRSPDGNLAGARPPATGRSR